MATLEAQIPEDVLQAIGADTIEQFENIRVAGPCNMLDSSCVQRAAFEEDYHDLVLCIEDGNYGKILKHYSQLMTHYKVSDDGTQD